MGGSCDVSCIDEAIRICTDPDADGVQRMEGVVGPSLLPGLSWQSSVATGFSNFLRDRAIAEGTLWVASKLQEQLCSNDLRQYFRHACRLVTVGPNGVAPLSSSMAAAAIRSDLEELPLRVTRTQVSTPGSWASDASIALLIELLNGVRNGDAPLTLLAGFGINEALAEECPKTGETLACSLRRVGSLVSFLGLAAQPSRAEEEPDFSALARTMKKGLEALKGNTVLPIDAFVSASHLWPPQRPAIHGSGGAPPSRTPARDALAAVRRPKSLE